MFVRSFWTAVCEDVLLSMHNSTASAQPTLELDRAAGDVAYLP